MPKARETCTRCSMRRQKCDREEPCNRCTAAGVAESCTREWKEGYDPAVHRRYPRTRTREAGPRREVGRQAASSVTDSVGSASVAARNRVNAIARPDQARYQDSPGGDYTQMTADEADSELPDVEQMARMITYFDAHLSWYTWCIAMPFFNEEFNAVFHSLPTSRPSTVDRRWIALLEAILCAVLTCADSATIDSWGLSPSKHALCRQWYASSLAHLNTARFMARPHVYSLQTILTLSLAGHVLGNSSEIFTLFGVAIRLVQKLAFHQLSFNQRLDGDDTPDVDKNLRHRREIGRRIWQQLCIHDENSTVTVRMRLLHKNEYTTTAPSALDMYPSDDLLAYSFQTTWMKQVSGIVSDSFDVLNSARTEEQKFQEIVLLDAKLRGISTPNYLAAASAVWTQWATQEVDIIRNNKLGFIHRYFFGKSFTTPAYAYSRWASIDAARKLINTVVAAYENFADRPLIWNDHDSALAANGLRVVASLTKGTRTQTSGEQDHEELAWPLENNETIDTMLVNGSLQNGPPDPPAINTANANPTLAGDIFGDLSWMDLFGVARFPPHPRPLTIHSYIKPLTEMPYLTMTAAFFFFYLGLFLPINYIEIQANQLGMSPSLAAYLIPILNGASMFGRILPGIVGDRIGRFRTVIVMAFGSAISILALWLPARGNAPIIVFAALYGFFSGAGVSLIAAMVAQISDIQEIGLRIGLEFAILSIPALVSNPIGGALDGHDHGGFQSCQIFAGVMILVGSCLFIVSRLTQSGLRLKAIY